ncbi:MAG TPA: GNAT family N-acetyltransferase [Actinomycetota bacterium]|nr:GNAT family N-acetyltransferase [Actinomycetota bacterium]
MAQVRELLRGETHLGCGALLELRPHFESEERLARVVDEVQRKEGYRLAGSFDEASSPAAAVAGFRTGHNLAWGHYLYVDDLVTLEAFRNRGHAGALMKWLVEEARRLACDQLHLDSGTHRHAAHRFYLNQRMDITSLHFGRRIQ